MLYKVQSVLQKVHSVLQKVHSMLQKVHGLLCILHSVLYKVHSVLDKVHCVLNTVHSVLGHPIHRAFYRFSFNFPNVTLSSNVYSSILFNPRYTGPRQLIYTLVKGHSEGSNNSSMYVLSCSNSVYRCVSIVSGITDVYSNDN